MLYRSMYLLLLGACLTAVGLVYRAIWRVYEPGIRQVEANSTKTILLWYPHSKFYQMGPGREGFAWCPVNDCALTDDRSLLPAVSAVIVRGAQISGVLPTHVNSGQVFVFIEFESPMSIYPSRLKDTSGLFNLSMTYLSGADIYIPYGEVISRSEPNPGAVPSIATLQDKNRLVAWVVSNCHPTSTRQQYVQQLSHYVSVDIYGHCGNLTCAKMNATCYKELAHEHLFILSFENAYCKDYITEKLFRPISHNIVPVVLGGGRYADVLPPKSYIDVRDFSSPAHLSQHLLYLQRNRTAYAEYFAWKANFVVKNSGYTRPRAFCRLCEILHDPDYKHRLPLDPEVYWSQETLCLRDDPERREVHLL